MKGYDMERSGRLLINGMWRGGSEIAASRPPRRSVSEPDQAGAVPAEYRRGGAMERGGCRPLSHGNRLCQRRGVSYWRALVWCFLSMVVGATKGYPQEVVAPGSVDNPRVAGYEELRALRQAYPSIVGEPTERAGQLAVSVRDEWFYWANGRLLPYGDRNSWDRYVPIRFYNYRLGPLQIPVFTEEQNTRLSTWLQRRRVNTRHNGFLDTLYGVSSRGDAEKLMVETVFYGLTVRAHPIIVEPLARVERDLRLLAGDIATRFMRGISAVGGFHWRDIAGTSSRSYHAYGVAVDFIPKDYEDRFGYWRWAAEAGVEQWWALPLNQRWNMPLEIVEVFERHGFVWGGKWTFFDPIHFEYRPEIIILANQ